MVSNRIGEKELREFSNTVINTFFFNNNEDIN